MLVPGRGGWMFVKDIVSEAYRVHVVQGDILLFRNPALVHISLQEKKRNIRTQLVSFT